MGQSEHRSAQLFAFPFQIPPLTSIAFAAFVAHRTFGASFSVAKCQFPVRFVFNRDKNKKKGRTMITTTTNFGCPSLCIWIVALLQILITLNTISIEGDRSKTLSGEQVKEITSLRRQTEKLLEDSAPANLRLAFERIWFPLSLFFSKKIKKKSKIFFDNFFFFLFPSGSLNFSG